MALCEIVEQLADIAFQSLDLTDSDREWLAQIRRIVHFRDICRLDEWEAAVNSASPPQIVTTNHELISEIEMLGLCNLYQAFQPKRTLRFYQRLVPFFAQHGVTIPTDVDLSDW